MDHETRSAIGLVAVSGGKMAECFTLQCWASQTMCYKDACWIEGRATCVFPTSFAFFWKEQFKFPLVAVSLPSFGWECQSNSMPLPPTEHMTPGKTISISLSLALEFSAEKHNIREGGPTDMGSCSLDPQVLLFREVCFLGFASECVRHSTSFLFMEASRNTFCCLPSKTRKWHKL